MKISGAFVLSFVFIILAAHIAAIFQEWYASPLWWIDIALHTAGGAWLAFVFFYAEWRYDLDFRHIPFLFVFVLALGFVMLGGVLWEWFEYGFDYIFVEEHAMWRAQLGLPDTMGDLLADFMGGALVSLYVTFRRRDIIQV